jgi:hypothetical protein
LQLGCGEANAWQFRSAIFDDGICGDGEANRALNTGDDPGWMSYRRQLWMGSHPK